MSQESLESLNTNVLIGNTDHRGQAWHYRAGHQGDQPNHYPGAIPSTTSRSGCSTGPHSPAESPRRPRPT